MFSAAKKISVYSCPFAVRIAASKRQSGLTLPELLVVMAVVVILLGISGPAAKKIAESFDHSAGSRGLIDAALSSARAMAISSSTPVGVRFQQDRNGDFYMIFIIHEDVTPSYSQDFIAMPNRKPMKLPGKIGVLDTAKATDADLSTPAGLMDAQTFSVAFSEQGQLIHFDVQVFNRDGVTTNTSFDPVFNTIDNVDGGVGMFYQDTHPTNGLDRETSIHSFYIYDKELFKETDTIYSTYIKSLQPDFVSPYSGQLIKRN